jgi:ubiquinone/menaquinone biosynthesis C-methylase UbiE
MNPDDINKKYWSEIEPENIMSGLCYPREELLSLLKPKSIILDVGCGNGKIAEYLHNKGYMITGIDINHYALKTNREKNPSIVYVEADITEELPFDNSSFDCIVVPYVFVSIINVEKERFAAKELMRVLKNGGLLWICEATLSEDYTDRYITGKEETGLNNVALSYTKDSKMVVQRVIRHFANNEIDFLFSNLKRLSSKQIRVKSPSSGMHVETIVSVFQKI